MIFIIAIFPCSLFAQDVDSRWSEFNNNKISFLKDLSKSVYLCENRTDTTHPVFHGCVDWHSSVHGYWALIRAAKYTKETGYLDFAKNNLASPLMKKERDYLNNNKYFEMPYGRAWFLRLAIEFESATKLMTLRPMADEVANSLVDYYKADIPKAGIGEYQNAEWALRNLYDYAIFTNNKIITSFVHSCIKHFLISSVKFNFENDKDVNPDFFSRYGNYLHFLEVTTDENTFVQILKTYPIDLDSIMPIQKFKNDHHLGVNYSRAWGLWSVYKKTKNDNYRDAYLNNVLMGLKEHDSYSNEYHRYGHWVPQF
jgi:hypothetical protein